VNRRTDGHDPASTSGAYRADIDGLRSLAVLLVLVFHFDLFGIGKAGFIGVDVFFVISGFLISSIIWKQLEAGHFSLRSFYLRRFRRLAPAFICVQLLLWAFAYAFMVPNEIADLVKQTVFAQTYLINFYLWRSINYFGLQADGISLLHCWSLAVEEQFYLTYPLFLLLLHRYGRRHLGKALLAVTVASFALNVAFVGRHPRVSFYLLPTRAWELALGAMLPLIQPWFHSRAWARQLASLAGLAAIAAGVLLYSPVIPFPGTFALLPTLGAAALLLAGTSGGSFGSRALSLAPLVYIGRISYSLYLVHWPVRVLIAERIPEYSLGYRWLSLGISFALAALLFHCVEDPVRRQRLFPGAKRFVVAYASGFAVVMSLAFSAHASAGWSFRFDPAALRIANVENDRDAAARKREYDGSGWRARLDDFRVGALHAKPEWFVFGDSHAWALASAFSRFLEGRGQAGYLVFHHGCMPVLGLGGDECTRFTEDIVRFVEAQPEVRIVVLVSIWRQVFEGEYLLGPNQAAFRGAERFAAFRSQYAETIGRLHAKGKKVIVWEPLPAAKMSVPRVLAWARSSGKPPEDIAPTRDEHERLFKFLTDATNDNRARILGTISPAATLCATGRCELVEDGLPLYFDNNHPTLSSAPFFAGLIGAQLTPLLDAR